MTELSGAKEGSTLVITIVPKDEDGVTVTPLTATWTLRDGLGNAVGTRTNVAIASPSSSMTIVLYSSDIAAGSTGNLDRVLTVKGTYDSSAGSNLPFAAEASFSIDPTPAVR